MNFTLRICFFMLTAFLAMPEAAFSWGPGHDDIMRAIIARLPADLRKTLTPEIIKEAVLHASHYPDSFEPFLAKDIGDAAIAKLTGAKLKVRYDLHSERGAAMCFIMLVDALREKNAAHTAHWIATLSHVISDMSACNHDPLVHTATYAWADWKLKLPNGKDYSKVNSLLDLADTARDTTGGADAFNDAIARQILKDDQRDVKKTLTEIMLYGQEGAAYCNSRGVSILEGAVGWVDKQDIAARNKLWKNIGELGAWAVVRTLRDVEVAIRFAQTDMKLEITSEIEKAHEGDVARILKDRNIADEALYAPILQKLKPDQAPAVGILLEPTWAMNGAMFGFASRVPSVAIARTLQRSGRSYATFDVRHLMADGFPSPERVPVMIIVANSYRGYHSLKLENLEEGLARYIKDGGRILWIMGMAKNISKSLAVIEKARKRQDDKSNLPVTDDQFLMSRLELVGSDLNALKIAHPAKTGAGWHNPYCPWTFDLTENKSLQPLVTLHTGSQSQTVGVITADKKIACIPVYALTPFIFEGGDTIPSAHEPMLDPVCEKVLNALLQRLK